MWQIIQWIKIEKIWYWWIGLARMSNGKRIIIKWWALPGSIVDLKIVKQKKDYVQAHIIAIKKTDPNITDWQIFCPHFFSLLNQESNTNSDKYSLHKIGCWWCKRQSLSYTNQLKLKTDIIQDAFNKLSKNLDNLEILPVIWSVLQKWYRNKIEFSFGKFITSIPEDKQKITEDETSKNIEEQEKINQITHDIIWISMEIHNQLWNWLREDVYKKALKKWLEKKWHIINLDYKVNIVFDGDTIGKWYIDVLVDNVVIVELKVIWYIDKKQFQQLRTYIQSSDQQTWLIIDFWGKSLQYKRLEKNNFTYQKWNLLESKKNLLVCSDRSIGFHKQWEFSKIIDIDNCWLISDNANKIFEYIKTLCKNSWLPVYDQKTHQWFFRHLVIREWINTGQFLINLSVSDNNLKKLLIPKRNKLLEKFKKDEFLTKQIQTFVITYNNWLADIIKSENSETKIFWWDGFIYEKLISKNFESDSDSSQTQTSWENQTEVTFRISPFSFFQTNTLWAQQLFHEAFKMVGNVQWTILDLYCWTWSIGLSFLKMWKWDNLMWIEIVPEAIVDAQYNAKINWLEENTLFLPWAAEKIFINNPDIKNKISNLWLVIVDPPRDGLHKNVISFLSSLKVQFDFKLIYISCNPITMARDIELFISSWFQLKSLKPVDMFPQTHHIEVIGILN